MISVIVPIYNVEKYLDQCIQSILKQTYKDFELILVNDGSPDNSEKICKKYEAIDNRIKYLKKKNGGLVSAWTYGLEHSKGKYICFIDPDDYVEANHFNSMYDAIKKYKVPFVIAPTYELREKNIIYKLRLKSGYYDASKYKYLIQHHILNDDHFQDRLIPPSRWGKLIRRDYVLNNIQYTDKRMTYGEDLSLIVPILLNIDRCYVLRENLNDGYICRIREDSMVQSYDKNRWKSSKIVYQNLTTAFQDYGATSSQFEQLYIDYLIASIVNYKNEIKSSEASAKKLEDLVYDIRHQKIFIQNKSNKVRIKNSGLVNWIILLNIRKNNKLLNKVVFSLCKIGYRIKE